VSESATQRVIRLLDLVPFLLNHPGISIDDVSDEFGITNNQLIKDLNLLFLCGLPGYTPLELIDISFDDGFIHIHDPQVLDKPRSLSQKEVLTLRIALASLKESLSEDDERKIKLEKLDRKLASIFSHYLPVGSFVFSDHGRSMILSTIRQSFDMRKKLRISYRNLLREDLTRRVVQPIELQLDDVDGTLRAFCDESQGERSFTLSNIEEALLTDLEFLPLPESDGSSPPALGKLLIRATPNSFTNTYFKYLQDEGANLYSITFFQLDWLSRTAIAYGQDLEIVSPLRARERSSQLARQALAQYRSVQLNS